MRGRITNAKYSNVFTEVDNIKFRSKREAIRYQELKMLERSGKITGLVLQPRYPINVNGQFICTYVADFRYKERGIVVIEDSKGMRTPLYKLKKKLVEALYAIRITEV